MAEVSGHRPEEVQGNTKETEIKNAVSPSVSRVLTGGISTPDRFHPGDQQPLSDKEKEELIKATSLQEATYQAAERIIIDSRKKANTDWDVWEKGMLEYAADALQADDPMKQERLAALKAVGLITTFQDEGTDVTIPEVTTFYNRYFVNEKGENAVNIKQFTADIAADCTEDGIINTQKLLTRLQAVDELLLAFGEDIRADLLVRDLVIAHGLLNQAEETKKKTLVPTIDQTIQQSIPDTAPEQPYLLALAEGTSLQKAVTQSQEEAKEETIAHHPKEDIDTAQPTTPPPQPAPPRSSNSPEQKAEDIKATVKGIEGMILSMESTILQHDAMFKAAESFLGRNLTTAEMNILTHDGGWNELLTHTAQKEWGRKLTQQEVLQAFIKKARDIYHSPLSDEELIRMFSENIWQPFLPPSPEKEAPQSHSPQEENHTHKPTAMQELKEAAERVTKFSAAKSFLGKNFTEVEMDILNHGGGWADLMQSVWKRLYGNDRKLTRGELRGAFVQMAQTGHHSPLSTEQLTRIFDENIWESVTSALSEKPSSDKTPSQPEPKGQFDKRLESELQLPGRGEIPETTTIEPTTEGLTVGNAETTTAEIFELNIPPQERESILQQTEIHGDEFTVYYDPSTDKKITRKLTVEVLDRAGLAPKYEVQSENATILYSTPYFLDNGGKRLAVVGYVKEDNKYIARTYYLSNSQGVWRYLPRYLSDGESGIRWFDKGYSEESITIPIPFQLALNNIVNETHPLQLPKENPYLYFAGTARQIETRDKDITYHFDVNSVPMDLDFEHYPRFENGRLQKLPPEEITFDRQPSAKPDFSRPILTWKQITEQYGAIDVEVYPSADGTLQYMFCRDRKDRAWIAGIENATSEITSVGLRRNWVNGGDLTTPAYEYETQVGKSEYANYADGKGHYVDMFQNYISKIPVIQEYLETKKRPEDPSMPVQPQRPDESGNGIEKIHEADEMDSTAEVPLSKERQLAMPVDFQVLRWVRQYGGYGVVGGSLSESNTRTNLQLQAGDNNPCPYDLEYFSEEGKDYITYGFHTPQLDEASDTNDPSRGTVSGVILGGKLGSLTAELALNLVSIGKKDTDQLRGWIPGHEDERFNPRSLTTEKNQPPATVRDLVQYEIDQSDAIYERMETTTNRDKMQRVMTALLEHPFTPDHVENNQRFVMNNIDERDAHAILWTMLKLFSAKPEMRERLGPWTFATNLQGKWPTRTTQFSFNTEEKLSYRSSSPYFQTIDTTSPLPDTVFARAAERLMDTFFANKNPQEVAAIITQAGEFNPENPEEWCERLVNTTPSKAPHSTKPPTPETRATGTKGNNAEEAFSENDEEIAAHFEDNPIQIAKDAARATSPEEVRINTEKIDAIMEELNNSIVQRAVEGKFPKKDIHLPGIPDAISTPSGSDYSIFPPTRDSAYFMNMTKRTIHPYLLQYEDIPQTTILFSGTDPRNHNRSIFYMGIPSSIRDEVHRPIKYVRVAFSLPNDKADLLLAMAQEYPDTIERFYQKAIGADSDAPRKDIERYQSPGILLVDKDKYDKQVIQKIRDYEVKEVAQRVEGLRSRIAQENQRYNNLNRWRKSREQSSHEATLYSLQQQIQKATTETERIQRKPVAKILDEISSGRAPLGYIIRHNEREIYTEAGAKTFDYKHGPYGKVPTQ